VARLYRDAYGVPHVRGTSVLDVAHGQGLVTARDRAWQLEFQRRRATGTTAEVLGRPSLAWDVLARRTRMVDTARRAFEGLTPDSADFVAAYVDGVNTGLHADAPELLELGIEPTAWEPWTPLAVFHAQHVLFASTPSKLWHDHARSVLGDDERLLSRDPSYASGSNAWAVGGGRTASGFPLIGGDPHRVVESPGVYMQVRLACEDSDDPFDVVGFTFPGVPGVQHFAHAGEVAWAITNAAADYQDVYEEDLGPGGDVVERRQETVTVRGVEPVAVEVITTPRGPVFEVEGERGLSLRGASAVLGDLGFDALLPLLRARSADDVDRALDRWVEPVNNVVIADRAGAVRYRIAGRIPVRDEANRHGVVSAKDPHTAWSGWVEPPRHDVPADGQVVTANERRGPESDAIGTEFAAPHRADRIAALLSGRDDLSVGDFDAILGDTLSGSLALLIPMLRELRPGAAGERVRQEILAWDGRMDADSRAAAAFAAWRTALTRRIVAEPVLAPLLDSMVHGPVFAPYLDLTASVGLTLETLVSHGTPFGIDVRRLATEALEDATGHPARWGDTHILGPTHAFDLGDGDPAPPIIPATAVSGDIDSVRCTGWLPALTDECYRGSVARYVWDLADRSNSAWVVPLGASGDPRSPHHLDQLEAWAEARLLPVVTDWDELSEEA
jgi:penicillin amidase